MVSIVKHCKDEIMSHWPSSLSQIRKVMCHSVIEIYNEAARINRPGQAPVT